MKNIPSDELTALAWCHIEHGRKAKSLIREFWMNGNHKIFNAGIDYNAIQRFRNAAHGGPSGLQKLSLKKLVQEAGI